MHPARKPRWQQVTALMSLSASGAVTGLSLVNQPPDALRSPAGLPVRLMALERSARPARSADEMLRSAIVNVSRYFLRMAQHRSPAEMEAIIWQHDSIGGADHGASCAAFASLTLELAAQVVGQQSWVTGGTSYPWPLHRWVDARVDPNAASPGIVSIVQDAQAHHRWHPLGDGYTPLPGDWVLFSGHVEVVTSYSGGVLSTIGGDSLPNYSVNAHEYRAPLAAQGVTGFVNNGDTGGGGGMAAVGGAAALASDATGRAGPGGGTASHAVAVPAAASGSAAIPGLAAGAGPGGPGQAAPGHHRRHHAPRPPAPAPGTDARKAFIRRVAPGAQAAQRRYGVPASVTIAQAIEESGWGRSRLATRDHNLFGIKGSGPAGSDSQPTLEYENGRWVTTNAAFRVYHSAAESIADHGRLLAESPFYRQAMAVRGDPNAFAAALTGRYATDPGYGAKLIALMREYDLYRYDTVGADAAAAHPPAVAGAAIPGPGQPFPVPAAPAPAAPPTGGRSSTPAPAPSRSPGTRPGVPRQGPQARGPRRAVREPSPDQAPASSVIAPGPQPALTGQRPAGPAAGSSAPHAARWYQPQIPTAVRNDFTVMARVPLQRSEPLYRDVAGHTGLPWQVLAACDWMQCGARPRYSPVHGEKLGTVNPDGTRYPTRSAALEQCADDLIRLADAVYRIDLTRVGHLSVGELASVFAAFRWGCLLRAHRTSAMEFPYSVAGLTLHHQSMRWPGIPAPHAPDRPGSRFRRPFGAVPAVLMLNYPATV